MFERSIAKDGKNSIVRAGRVVVEGLEDRRLLSAAHGFPMMGSGSGPGGGPFGGGAFGGPPPIGESTIQFDQAPSAVQSGLDSLASTDGLTAPTTSQTVYLSNNNGVEGYSIDSSSSGKNTRLTVDANGDAVTAPTQSTTTFGAITNTAVTGEISAIATALDLTAPTSTTNISVLTSSGGTSTYAVHLSSSSSSSPWGGRTITVDSNGNPVGNEVLPFSVLPTAIQNGLIANAPSGTSLSSSSTQNVFITTQDGVTLYTMQFNSTGTRTSITVNSSGDLTSLPSVTSTTYADVPSAAATELQTLATADGVSTSIASTQKVLEFSESNGTTVYSLTLQNSDSKPVTISVDEDGNPTVPPSDGSFGPISVLGGFGFGGFAFGGPAF
jgi:hypothetical protein